MPDIPSYDMFFNPLIQALKQLGGSGTIEEIDTTVAEIMNLSEEQLEVLHNPEKSLQTEVQYQLAWTRTYLKKYGLLQNSRRGVWALTAEGLNITKVDRDEVKRHVRELTRRQNEASTDEEDASQPEEITWQQDALQALLNMKPDAFERLIQRLLREAGFTRVEVLGKSGDGGIDGKGVMQLGGLLSFHVYFQCKRYNGAVSSAQVRDFRGAIAGRADKGLLITTGHFTKDAKSEAIRDGAQPIDLINGKQLVEKLKEFGMGIKTKIIVDTNWFQSI